MKKIHKFTLEFHDYWGQDYPFVVLCEPALHDFFIFPRRTLDIWVILSDKPFPESYKVVLDVYDEHQIILDGKYLEVVPYEAKLYLHEIADNLTLYVGLQYEY